MDFLKYYERELTFTRELAAEFTKKHPKVAARLLLEPDKCEDPHMERLIEAFAFECARLHMKIDDDFPEIVEPLLNVVFPHFLRPIPSMSVVRFDPTMTTVPPSGHRLGKNTALFSKLVDGTSCQFNTVSPVTLWPAEVVSAGLREPRRLVKDAKKAIVIQLKTCNGLSLGQVEWETLRFFINGPKRQAFHIHELLLNNACHVEYVASNQHGNSQTIILTPWHIQPVGFKPDEAMLPSLRNAFPGFLLLLEYFCFPEKFLFIDFKGLEKFRPKDMDTLELWIYLDKEAKPDLTIDKNTFSIHCAPVVNLFTQIGERITFANEKTEYRIDPDIRRNDTTEIFSVDKVAGKDKEFTPVYSLQHLQPDSSEYAKQVFCNFSRRPSGRKGDDGTDVYLSFVNSDLKPTDPGEEIITVHLTCTNRDLPGRITVGGPSADFQSQAAAQISTIKCLIKPTPTRRISMDGMMHWQTLSSLKPNYLPLMRGQEEAFKDIIRLYDLDASPVTKRLIDGIRSVQSQHVTRRIGQRFFRGVEITIGFDEQNYEESGLYQFTSVLERFLSQYVSSNSFTQLVVKTLPEKEIFKIWPPRRGGRPLL